jgi:hypothetical protein
VIAGTMPTPFDAVYGVSFALSKGDNRLDDVPQPLK